MGYNDPRYADWTRSIRDAYSVPTSWTASEYLYRPPAPRQKPVAMVGEVTPAEMTALLKVDVRPESPALAWLDRRVAEITDMAWT